jgi:hypothetical protein
MGAGSTRANVTLCLSALTDALREQGFQPRGDALAAAAECYRGARAEDLARAPRD